MISYPMNRLGSFIGVASLALVGPPLQAGTTPEVLLADARVHAAFGEQRLVLAGGLQPYLLGTSTGALMMQSQLPDVKPFPTKRISYQYAMGTVVSHDEGKSWTPIPLQPGRNGGDFEGGAVQLRDGTILALDTFVTPGKGPDDALGQMYLSKNDWGTLEGPVEITFHLPGVTFSNTTDDIGREEAAVRLHRRIIELPNGDLLTTLYGWFDGDTEPTTYMPSMWRTRVVLLRSTNRGRHWEMVSTVAAERNVGSEGFGEPVLIRVSTQPHAGRLICQMRTGRELREAISDDEGKTWSPSRARVFADLDVYRTEQWKELFRGIRVKKGAGGGLANAGELIENVPGELIGAVVDPDLLELGSGVLVAAFGVRVPPRACWPRAEYPWNGNYLAFSLDHGDTWSHVVRLTSGVLTTHYMAIEAMPEKNRFFVTYDLGDWRSNRGRSIYGRPVELTIDAGNPKGSGL